MANVNTTIVKGVQLLRITATDPVPRVKDNFLNTDAVEASVSRTIWDSPEYHRYECDNCRKRFADKAMLANHLMGCYKCHDFSCPYCQFTMHSLGKEMIEHIKKEHGGRAIYCKASLEPDNWHISTGNRAKTNVNGPYFCNKCTFSSRREYTLIWHTRHECNRRYVCLLCGNTYSGMNNMKKHAFNAHKTNLKF